MKYKSSILAVTLPLLATFIGTAGAAVSIPAGGVTVGFNAAPSGADFASVNMAGAVADTTDVAGLDADVNSNLSWPATPTAWTSAANSIANEPAATALNAQVRYVTGTGRMLTGPTGNRYHALIGQFQNNVGGAITSLSINWTLGTPFDAAGTGAPGADPLAGISVYYSPTGTAGSWQKVSGPHATDGLATSPATVITPATAIPQGGMLYFAWVDDNGPASGTAPNFEGHFTVDDIVIADIVTSSVSIAANVSNVVRNTNGTPATPADDTVDFTLTVNGFGAVSPGWKISSPFSLSTQTGTYGVAKTITGVPISEFPTVTPHTLDILVEDSANPTVTSTVVLTAPWCQVTPVVSNVSRNGNGTPDPSDDTWSYTVTVNGQYGGAGFNSDNASIPNPGTYGTAYVVSSIPIAFMTESTTFTDLADPACTATITVSAPTIIGTKNFGTAEPLFTDGNGVPANWVVDETGLTQTMNNGGGAPRKVYRSAVIDLTAIADVKFSANLQAVDTSAGFEADDTFVAQLIIDGATSVNLITTYDINGNGTMEGGAGAADDEFNAAKAADGSYTSNFPLFAVIPASANSVQLVIAGATNSTNETLRMQSILFEFAGHSIVANLVPGVQFDNKGTVSAADDEFRQGVNITAISPPGGSTGWNSNSTPASGLYSAANPVLFGPYPQTDPARDVILTDNGVPAVTTTVNIPPPAPTLVTAYVANTLTRNDNGTPNPADDTLTADFTVSAPVGGPSFVLETHPGGISANTTALSATPQTITVTMTDVPANGSVFFIIRDASYPASYDIWEVTPNAVVVSEYVLAKKNLGAGLSNVVTLAGSPLPPEWSNFPSVPAVQMNNGGGAPAKVLTSEVIDLTGVSGVVNFTANLRVIDTSSGAEADDTFLAQLILDGDTVNPVNLIATYDLDTSGAMNDDELAPPPPAGGNLQVLSYPISASIPDSVNNVQLVITGINNSDSEIMIFEDALFSIGAPVADTDGDGQTDASETVAGTDPNNPNDYLRITALTQGAGSVSISFPSKANRSYQAEVSDQLEGGWTALGPVVAGTGADISVPLTPVPVPGESKYFLRIRVVP